MLQKPIVTKKNVIYWRKPQKQKYSLIFFSICGLHVLTLLKQKCASKTNERKTKSTKQYCFSSCRCLKFQRRYPKKQYKFSTTLTLNISRCLAVIRLVMAMCWKLIISKRRKRTPNIAHEKPKKFEGKKKNSYQPKWHNLSIHKVSWR